MTDQIEGSLLAAVQLRLRNLAHELAALADEADDRRPEIVLSTHVAAILHARRLRERSLGEGLFFDPGWDILLTLFLAKLEGRSMCIADLGVIPIPATTLLRWVKVLVACNAIVRSVGKDLRKITVSLSDDMAERMEQYFHKVSALPL